MLAKPLHNASLSRETTKYDKFDLIHLPFSVLSTFQTRKNGESRVFFLKVEVSNSFRFLLFAKNQQATDKQEERPLENSSGFRVIWTFGHWARGYHEKGDQRIGERGVGER